MKIYIVITEGIFDTGLSTILDVFSTANELAERAQIFTMPFAVQCVGANKKIRTAQGLEISVQLMRDLPAPDLCIIPALGAKTPEALTAFLAKPVVAKIGQRVTAWHQQGSALSAACTGTFLLAESGLLNQQSATTSWWLSPFFRARYPAIYLDESRMLVNAGQIVTAGAALAHLDLALWWVRQYSPELARITAHYLLIDDRPSQALYILPDHLAHDDKLIRSFENWARGHLHKGFDLATAAKAVGASERTLARRLQAALGKSPLSYFQDLRIERALHLLRTSSASIDQIAEQVGYADGLTLRQLFKRKLGRGVRELRRGRE